MLQFGTGAFYAQRNDIANQGYGRLAVLQESDWNFDYDEKELMGTGQFPLMVARGAAKWKGKVKSGTFSANVYNALFFGQTVTTGGTSAIVNEPHTVPASSPYTITITPASGSTYAGDLGVSYSGDLNAPMTLVTVTPTVAGTYEQSAGVYTFGAADAGKQVWISYTVTVTTGQSISLTNQILGTTPTFAGTFVGRDPRNGYTLFMQLNKLTSSKMSFGSKTSDFSMGDFDVTIMDDGTGNIGTIYLAAQ
jgi:hypothetical protein